MHSTFGDFHVRRRRPILWRLLGFGLGAVLALGPAVYGYQVGASAKETRIEALEDEAEQLRARRLELSDQLALARRESQGARAALAELRTRYAAEVPEGDLAFLLDRVRRQLDGDTAAERLALFIDAAGRPAACEDEPETKRFVPRTPIDRGPVSAVRFDGRVTVTGHGQPARDGEGLAEAWFDPAAAVRVDFRTLDGAVTTVRGTLPLHHRMLVDGREYRFAIVEGERSFAEITAQACDVSVPGAAGGPPPDPA